MKLGSRVTIFYALTRRRLRAPLRSYERVTTTNGQAQIETVRKILDPREPVVTVAINPKFLAYKILKFEWRMTFGVNIAIKTPS
ncbi:hypothetical protein L1987_38860 [Smallanthus sonchifolius]|uniref:Uncharacterized protein n=1 Tax=Smallanthus sonchifolius TaxID=185202 RepID=A0ACB9HLQ6_9ASTR|nr:hypothetical protein L1987_38860 [Smallanthus sonchifolius]